MNGASELAPWLMTECSPFKYPHVYVELDCDGHGIPGPEQDKAVEWLEKYRLNPASKKK